MVYHISTYEALLFAPVTGHAALLMRHSQRYPILDPSMVSSAGLTPDGVKMAEDFGIELSQTRLPGRLLSSPIERCMDTANAISRGANWGIQVTAEERLSYLYPAWGNTIDCCTEKCSPELVVEVVNFLLTNHNEGNRLDVFITHDTILNSMVSMFLGQVVHKHDWPEFLEGMALWREEQSVQLAWRGGVYDISEKLGQR
jgi:phosphohistidine phosphatase SixA